MYYNFGINKILEIIKIISGTEKQQFSLDDQEVLQKYNTYLEKNSVFDTPITWGDIKIIDLNELKTIALDFYTNKHKFFKENSPIVQQKIQSGSFHTALSELRLDNIKLYNLSKFIIRTILINQLREYTNGTTVETIGLANFDFKDNFNNEDFKELLVHQLTHMILFLDNANNKHVIDNCEETMLEVGLRYKLGGTMFPAYICFHSYLVAVEVLSHRRHLNNIDIATNCHGSTMRILTMSNHFGSAINNNLNLFTDYGRTIIAKGMSIISEITKEFNLQ
tara:strand:+ start:2538 stop:3374 length:837 start_codon:yes stop_codon:yes gene_type:complete